MKQQWWKQEESGLDQTPIVKVPLQFHFQPVEILSKQLTKLNSSYEYRIHYLGPRWENSSLIHKKYSKQHEYSYNDKLINNNNTFLSESMTHNQFYRNQVYYRAFEGMNPTIPREEELEFDSRFECGNLDCVVKVADDQYDLFLRIDSNTKGHIFWFYFAVSNIKEARKIKFNICNLTKTKSLYQKGFKPYSCAQSSTGEFVRWTQDKVENVRIQQKKLRYDFIYERIKVRTLSQLSFTYNFAPNATVRFAYCIPYTYTKLIREIRSLENCEVGWLGKSLTGVNIPILKIGDFEENVEKPVMFLMGRLHPGESNGSITLSGFLKFLCQSSEAAYLRKKVVTIAVPMANPDGVILGNSRTGAAGKDLNREFKSKNRVLFPEVHLVKYVVEKIQEYHDIEIFLDFHGHSQKKNMFLFGPNYNLTQLDYYKSRVMPKYLSQLTSIFRYYGCDYTIPAQKMSTARAVMLNELGVPYVYTVETSVGMYYDYEQLRDMPFTTAKFEELGASICKATKQYFESVQQYQEYIRMKNLQQESFRKQNKPEKVERLSPIKNDCQRNRKVASNTSTPTAVGNVSMQFKDIRLLKLYEEIKVLQQKKSTSTKKKDMDQVSEASSDTQNEEDNLQKLKMAEFEGMVTQCIQVEKRRKEQAEQLLDRRKKKESPTPPMKIRSKKKKKVTMKEEFGLINEILCKDRERVQKIDEVLVLPAHNERKNHAQVRKQYQSYDHSLQRKVASEEQRKKASKCPNHAVDYEAFVESYKFTDDLIAKQEAQLSSKNKTNLRMFNFSKMMDNQETRIIVTSGRYRKEKFLTFPHKGDKRTQYVESAEEPEPHRQNLNMKLESQIESMNEEGFGEFARKEEKVRTKAIFPAPFYRIKYQNFQKRKLKSIEHSEHDKDSKEVGASSRKKDAMFLKIKKVE